MGHNGIKMIGWNSNDRFSMRSSGLAIDAQNRVYGALNFFSVSKMSFFTLTVSHESLNLPDMKLEMNKFDVKIASVAVGTSYTYFGGSRYFDTSQTYAAPFISRLDLSSNINSVVQETWMISMQN